MIGMYNYNSSSAHKLNYSELSHNSYSKEKTSKIKTPAKAKRTAKARFSLPAAIKSFFLVSVCFVTAFFIVRGYVAIYESENNIISLQNELKEVEAENQSIKAKIDESVDLKNLQSVASEKFGMVKPENYQIFYVDLELDDYTENVDGKKSESENSDIPVESVTGVLINAAEMFR